MVNPCGQRLVEGLNLQESQRGVRSLVVRHNPHLIMTHILGAGLFTRDIARTVFELKESNPNWVD